MSAALLTDLYQLTMLAAYHAEGMEQRAVFSLFVRRLPASRNWLLAAGLDDVLTFLEGLRFEEDELAWLGRQPGFDDPEFLAALGRLRFTGDVWALPEGTPFFANEPVLEVEAPLPEAQLVESYVMNRIHLHTLLASKAARVRLAAAGRPVVDFGMRRMHGTDAAVSGARAYHVAGLAGTSNVLAARRHGMRPVGTMAHSYIQAHGAELDAFRAFARRWPETTLLVDTYDTLDGVRNVIDLARELGDDFRVQAIRLDSGDLAELAFGARRLLDAAGLQRVRILASGSLDEYRVEKLVASGAPIDAFGVGTSMGVSADAPYLDLAYKLVSYGGEGRTKLAPGKPILPGRKQVFRRETDGRAEGDVIAGADEAPAGRPLLHKVMEAGRRLPAGTEAVEAARARAQAELARLPERLLALSRADPPYPVEVSDALKARHAEVIREVERRR